MFTCLFSALSIAIRSRSIPHRISISEPVDRETNTQKQKHCQTFSKWTWFACDKSERNSINVNFVLQHAVCRSLWIRCSVSIPFFFFFLQLRMNYKSFEHLKWCSVISIKFIYKSLKYFNCWAECARVARWCCLPTAQQTMPHGSCTTRARMGNMSSMWCVSLWICCVQLDIHF